MKRIRRMAALVLLAGCFNNADTDGPLWQPDLPVTKAEDPRPLRVLFVGNSLTYYNDLPDRTAEIAAANTALRALEVHQIVKGGASLELHWNDGVALARIRAERWDFVVLQEGTMQYYDDPLSVEDIVREFDREIRLAGARTVFYMTWPHEATIPQDSFTRVVQRMSQALRIRVAPVGEAWQAAFTAQPGLPLYLPDGNHPSPVGTYLGACTMFSALYRRTPAGLAGTLAVGDTNVVTLDPAVASLLQQTAWTTTLPWLH